MVGFLLRRLRADQTSPLSLPTVGQVGTSRLNTVGKVANGVKVIDTDGQDDPERPDEGEIVVTGPNVMMGFGTTKRPPRKSSLNPAPSEPATWAS